MSFDHVIYHVIVMLTRAVDAPYYYGSSDVGHLHSLVGTRDLRIYCVGCLHFQCTSIVVWGRSPFLMSVSLHRACVVAYSSPATMGARPLKQVGPTLDKHGRNWMVQFRNIFWAIDQQP